MALTWWEATRLFNIVSFQVGLIFDTASLSDSLLWMKVLLV